MAKQCHAQIDEQGRLYVPKATRKALGINGKSANVELTVEVIDDE